MEQTRGLRAGDWKQAAVSQDAPGDLRRPPVIGEDHGGAADQPHRQRLRPRDLLGEVSAKALRLVARAFFVFIPDGFRGAQSWGEQDDRHLSQTDIPAHLNAPSRLPDPQNRGDFPLKSP